MLTEFGMQLRMIRLACGERILDMAEKLGETPAFISKLERGAIPLPEGFDEKIINSYRLSQHQANQVSQAFKRTQAKEKQQTTASDNKSLAGNIGWFWVFAGVTRKLFENGPFKNICRQLS